MKGALGIFRFLLDAADRGERTALVTITDIIGSSSRSPGTHLAISDSGAFHGSVSGGCIEAAVVSEAMEVIASGKSKRLRLGAGSPYIDIRLPCGGGLDLLIVPNPLRDLLAQSCERLERRHCLDLALDPNGDIKIDTTARNVFSGWSNGIFQVHHDPELRLVVVGHGAETQALAELATIYGAAVEVWTPDPVVAQASRQIGARVVALDSPESATPLAGDPHTAVVVLFHDHDWEDEFLVRALEATTFFIGAMGSPQTHERRLAKLRRRGIGDDRSGRIVGPVGLIASTRDPKTLALSILSQVVDAYGRSVRTAPQRSTRSRQPNRETNPGTAEKVRSVTPDRRTDASRCVAVLENANNHISGDYHVEA